MAVGVLLGTALNNRYIRDIRPVKLSVAVSESTANATVKPHDVSDNEGSMEEYTKNANMKTHSEAQNDSRSTRINAWTQSKEPGNSSMSPSLLDLPRHKKKWGSSTLWF